MAFVGERVGEGGLVDDRAPGGVDQDRGRLHQREPARVDEVVRLVGQRGVDADDVRLAQPLVEVDPLARDRGELHVPLPRARGVEHAHAPRLGAGGDGVADPPGADDQQRAPGQVHAQELRHAQRAVRLSTRPCARTGRPRSGGARRRG
jgi:hypothetical protein